MLKKKIAAIAAACALSFGVSSYVAPSYSFAEEVPYTMDEVKAASTMFADFSKGKPNGWFESDGWSNEYMFNTYWTKSMVTWKNKKMQLLIAEADGVGTKPYISGEYRTAGYYGYGRYSVNMKAIKNDGVVSSFFTCTGNYDNNNEWDEIDFEILGKDTTKVQLNFFRNGTGGHEYMVDLGFDSSEDFHTYTFDWHADKIIWYVDGQEVHRVEGKAAKEIPFFRGRILMNAWPGIGVDDWLNEFDDSALYDEPLAAEYQWAAFTPFTDEQGTNRNNVTGVENF